MYVNIYMSEYGQMYSKQYLEDYTVFTVYTLGSSD